MAKRVVLIDSPTIDTIKVDNKWQSLESLHTQVIDKLGQQIDSGLPEFGNLVGEVVADLEKTKSVDDSILALLQRRGEPTLST